MGRLGGGWGRIAGAALVLTLALPSGAWAQASLKHRIEARLAKLGLDQRADIQVSVEAGVPRLEGFVLVLADLRAAERAARKEARAVVNLLRVVPEEVRKDRALLEDAQAEIRSWERYGALDAIDVSVEDGLVRLHGWVDREGKRDEIEDRLARIVGVRDIHSDLHVQGFSAWDVKLRNEIMGKLYASPHFEHWAARADDPPVRVFVARGRVILAGTVASAVEQQAAGMIARQTLAFSVSNQVRVLKGDAPEEPERPRPSPN
jgi:osmotically-inducible protein OsmY